MTDRWAAGEVGACRGQEGGGQTARLRSGAGRAGRGLAQGGRAEGVCGACQGGVLCSLEGQVCLLAGQ